MKIAGCVKKMLFRLNWKMMSRQARIAALSMKKMELQELRLRQFDLAQLY